MASAHLIVVGKLKDKNLEIIESSYLKRISHPKLNIHEVKAQAERPDIEAQAVLKKISDLSKNAYVILLDEQGKEFTSTNFSRWFYALFDQGHNEIFFVIGGAEGHHQLLKEKAQAKLSLSKLTLPHKLARIFFIEQYYRGQTIKQGHPYHNN